MPSILSTQDDPITRALQPPPEESPDERDNRIRQEKEAKRISDEIDAQLRHEERIAAAAKKRSQPVYVLLLGQSESGKSTTLKNFQMVWAPQSWREERASWRSVVLLNIVKSTFNILSVLFTPSSSTDNPPARVDLDALFANLTAAESILKRRLCAGTDNDEPGDYRTGSNSVIPPDSRHGHEFFVRSNISWKERLVMRARKSNSIARSSAELNGNGHGIAVANGNGNGYANGCMHEHDEAMDILLSCKHDIQELWTSPVVQELLYRRDVRLEESPGFFMNDLERILVEDYEPSDDDVIRARLRTMGIQEHKFVFETGSEVGREWIIYDVGGSRPQRASWFSFFDNVNAIIFLCPVNCFDEVLEEDHGVNRLQDSVELWKEICRSPLLAKVQLILFMNKVDLLQRKLESGVPFAHYIPKFGDRPNNRDTVCRYLRNQFKDIQKRYSPQPRSFNAWLTCATDTRATEKTLATVRYGIIKENFSDADLV